MVSSPSHRNAGQGSKRADYGLGRVGSHIAPHVTGKGGPTPPQLMRRDQTGLTFDPPNDANRVLRPRAPPRG
jgi:hypothetical protein